MIDELFTDLYYKKSTKNLSNAIDDVVDSVSKFHGAREGINKVTNVTEENNDMLKELETRHKKYKDEIIENSNAYWHGKRTWFVYKLVKLLINIKAFIWIIFWYIRA